MLAWLALLAVDLWQAFLLGGAAFTIREEAWLAALYAAPVAVGILVLRLLGRRRSSTATAIVLGLGLGALALGLAFRSADVGAERTVAFAVGVAATLAIIASARRYSGHAPVALATVLVIGGGLLAAGASGGSRSLPAAPSGASTGRPNVLLVVIDTLRADHLGCYGYARPTSPALDALAREGVRFERAYAQSSWTKPSTASLLTSRLPSQHGAVLEASVLPDSETTLAELLHDAGYRTAAVSANPWITAEYGFGQGVDRFVAVYDERFARVTLAMTLLKRLSLAVDGTLRLYNRVKYRVLGELSTTARDVRVVDDALAWMAVPDQRPFFLYLHLMSPHHPYDPPPPFDRFVPDRTHAPVKNYPRKSYDPFETGEALAPDALADMVARYDGDVLHADAQMGRLLAGLDRLGLAGDTLVVVTADHGEEFFDHGNWGHGQSVYEELVRVPLIVRWPGRLPAGSRPLPVRHLDVMPSVLAAAGLPPAPAAMGRHAFGGSVAGAEAVAELVYRAGTARMLVTAGGDRKLVELRRGAERRRLLFDLAMDPGERHPLPDEAQTNGLAARLDEIVTAAEATRASPAQAAPDPETQERLRQLGYGE